MEIIAPGLIDSETGLINSKYTCDGVNISPLIKWSGAPEDTKAYAVYVHDPDAPSMDWIHWIVINISASVNELPEGGPIKGAEVTNDFGKTGYGGPCPPSGTHRYFFEVYALSERLEGVTKDNFLDKVKKAELDHTQLVGKYERKMKSSFY